MRSFGSPGRLRRAGAYTHMEADRRGSGPGGAGASRRRGQGGIFGMLPDKLYGKLPFACGVFKAMQPFTAHFCTGAAALGVSALYFRSLILLAGGAALLYKMAMPLVIKHKESRHAKKRRKDTLVWLGELTMALQAGKSLATATEDMALRLTDNRERGMDAEVREGWLYCRGLIQLRYPIGTVYRELARRLALPELHSLAALIASAVDTGANLPRVFIRSAEGMREQIESVEAMEASLASRRMEGCLLTAAPALYTAFLCLVTPDYMAPLYMGNGWLPALLVFGLQIGGGAAFFRMMAREEDGRAGLALAGFQEEIALHLQAGLSLPEAWQRAAYSRMEGQGAAGRDNDFQRLLALVARQLAMGMPFGKAMTLLLQEKGGEGEISRLAAFLRQNYQMGSGSLAPLLATEAKEARQRNLMQRKAREGRRETILLFPMILLLLSALVLTAAPALLSV